MLHRATKVRIEPTQDQKVVLAQHFGCARWFWNYALNLNVTTYKETGKGLTQVALNQCLPILNKSEETVWLAECYSQVLRSVTLNLVTAYKNFFALRARYPRFKSKKNHQSIQYPLRVKIVGDSIKFPGRLGIVNAKLHRPIEGKIKTVTVSVTPSGKYLPSILTSVEGENPETRTDGKVAGIDLGLTNFAIVYDCHYQICELPLNERVWDCPNCGAHDDRDENVAINIRAEGIRQLWVLGTGTPANGEGSAVS